MTPRTQSPSRHRRFCLQLLALIALMVGLVGAFNMAIDPYGVYRHAWSQRFDGYRPTQGSRIYKMETARRGGIDVLYVGSSRVEVGLDPAHPSFEGQAVYNAGLSGCWLQEQLAVIHFALDHAPPKQVILVLDFSYWEQGRAVSSGYATGRHYAGFNPVDYHARLLLGAETIERSAQTMKNRQRNQRPSFRDGLLIRDLKPAGVEQRGVFRDTMRDKGLRGGFVYNQNATQQLAAVLRRCRDMGVETTVVLSPTHAVRLVNAEHHGLWPEVERWKRELTTAVHQINAEPKNSGNVAAVTLWDFCTADGPNIEPVPSADDTRSVMQSYWDPGHFRLTVGDRVLSRISGEDDSHNPFGTRLTPEVLEAHLLEQRRRLTDYKLQHPNDAALISP